MTAVRDLLAAVAAHGAALKLEGGGLILEAVSPLPDTLIANLKAHRESLKEALSRPSSRWTAADWRSYLEEREGIARFDGGLTEAEARRLAREDAMRQWEALNPIPADRAGTHCASCGGPAGPDALAILTRGGHIFVHEARCHAALRARRWREAGEALDRILGSD
jgi:hypothetical protein